MFEQYQKPRFGGVSFCLCWSGFIRDGYIETFNRE